MAPLANFFFFNNHNNNVKSYYIIYSINWKLNFSKILYLIPCQQLNSLKEILKSRYSEPTNPYLYPLLKPIKPNNNK